MYSSANQILYDEHQVILQARTQILKILANDELWQWVERIDWYITFFQTYGDVYHHQKEEETLFKIVAKNNPMLAESIVQALTEHHIEFRDKLGELRSLLKRERWDKLQALFQQYLADLRDHIEAEDSNFFKVADDILSSAQLHELHVAFLEKDKLLGLERKRELEATIEEKRWK